MMSASRKARACREVGEVLVGPVDESVLDKPLPELDETVPEARLGSAACLREGAPQREERGAG